MVKNLSEIGYVPPPSVGHELGIMFGFIGAMLLSMLAYGIAWQIGNKRSARIEAERVEALRASGWLKEKAPFSDSSSGGGRGQEERVERVGNGGAGAGAGREPEEIKI